MKTLASSFKLPKCIYASCSEAEKSKRKRKGTLLNGRISHSLHKNISVPLIVDLLSICILY
jgi:hypothetical protein